MPIYEYVCQDCETRFEELRPLSRIDDSASCPKGHRHGRRVLSTFAALTRDAEGAASSVAGGGCGSGCGGGCANCACSLN
jgi:putative FmdB family regulatory protein